MIKIDDDEFKQYTVKLSEFKELTGTTGNEVFKYVDVMTNELMSNPFWVGNVKLNWVSMAKYLEGEGVVVFEIHRLLKPYLLELKKNFVQYDITNILLLKSGYVIRLYELCKDHLNQKKRYDKNDKNGVVFEMKIEELRELFEIPKSYLYKDIRVHILDKAKKQFSDKTDISIGYEERKIGRRVDSIFIFVNENNKGSNDYLKDIQSFISYIRKSFVNADLLECKDKNTGKAMILSVAPDGKLYDKRGVEFDAVRAQELWLELYYLAIQNELYSIYPPL
jgi:plasmid replication initiation protein